MGFKFVGGPYDGMEIDPEPINKYAHLAPVEGDLGHRLFVFMPDSPAAWERMIRGEEVKPKKLIPYERYLVVGGALFVAARPDAFDRALSEARLKVHSRARIALSALSEGDRRRVIEATDALQGHRPGSWPEDKVIPLGTEEPLYLLQATPEFRVLIRPHEGGKIEMVDVVHEETLKLFLEAERRATASP